VVDSSHDRIKSARHNIVELDGAAMAEQSLIENIQRDNLPEIDWAETIDRPLTMLTRAGSSRTAAVNELCQLLGYKQRSSITDYLEIDGRAPDVHSGVQGWIALVLQGFPAVAGSCSAESLSN
jgi:hypothetical protein